MQLRRQIWHNLYICVCFCLLFQPQFYFLCIKPTTSKSISLFKNTRNASTKWLTLGDPFPHNGRKWMRREIRILEIKPQSLLFHKLDYQLKPQWEGNGHPFTRSIQIWCIYKQRHVYTFKSYVKLLWRRSCMNARAHIYILRRNEDWDL